MAILQKKNYLTNPLLQTTNYQSTPSSANSVYSQMSSPTQNYSSASKPQYYTPAQQPKTNYVSNPLLQSQPKVTAQKSVPSYTAPNNAVGQRADGSYITSTPATTSTPTPQPAPSATDTYIKNIQNRGQQRITEQGTTLREYLAALKEQDDLRKTESQAQKADSNAQFERFSANTRAGAEEVAKASQGLKDQTVENYGSALRRGAEAGREQEAILTGRFAGNNTLDSSAFQNAMINSKAGLVGQQQSTLNEQARKLTEIDSSVAKAKSDAEYLISNEGAKLQTTLRQIDSTYASGSIEYRQAVTEAYRLANENVNAIKDNLDQLSYNAEQEKLKLGNTDGLSESFMKTGVPETMADMIWRTKNPTDAKTLYEQATSQGTQAGGNQNKALTMVKSLLSQDTKPITGFNRIVVPGTAGSVTKTDWEGLKSLLTLAERGQLKGSGAVSDFETKMLEKAAAAGLSPNLPDDVFRQRLQQLQSDLESGGATSNVSQTIRVKSLQTGETGTIPVSEYDPSLYQQI